MNSLRFYIEGKATGDGGSGDSSIHGGYEVLTFKFGTSREHDNKGQPGSTQKAMLIELELYVFEVRNILLERFIDIYQQVSGRIDFYRNDLRSTSESKYRTLKFEKAYVVGYEESYVRNSSIHMTLKVVISAGKIEEEGSGITHDWAK